MNKLMIEKPQFIVKDGRAMSVILSIHDYKELLEYIEDSEHLKELSCLRRKPLKFRPFEEFREQGK